MKLLLVIFLSCFTISAFEKGYPFTKDFVNGNTTLPEGQLRANNSSGH